MEPAPTLTRRNSRSSDAEPWPLNTSTQAGVAGLGKSISAVPLLVFAVGGHNQAFLPAPAGGPHFCIACCMVPAPERSAGLHFGKEFGLNWKSSSSWSCIRLTRVALV